MNHIGQTWRLAATAAAVAAVLVLAAAGCGAGPWPDTGAVPEGHRELGQVCASLAADRASHDTTTTDTRAGRRWLVTGHQIDGGG
jgi:hypothetical protein